VNYIRYIAALMLFAFVTACGPGLPAGTHPSFQTPLAAAELAHSLSEYAATSDRFGWKAALQHQGRTYFRVSRLTPPVKHSGQPASRHRGLRSLVGVTTCTTTYLNVSGNYDATTDPVVGQTCETSYYDDGSGTGDGTGASNPCEAADDPAACYAASRGHGPYPKYKNADERNCEAAGGHFVTVNDGTNNGQERSDVGTKCIKPNNMPPMPFPYPGGCTNLFITVFPDGIVVDNSLTNLEQRSSTAVGVRVNDDCTTTWVPPSA
jgi:hypothetical protein